MARLLMALRLRCCFKGARKRAPGKRELEVAGIRYIFTIFRRVAVIRISVKCKLNFLLKLWHEESQSEVAGVAEDKRSGDVFGEGEAEALAADIATTALAVAALALVIEPDETAW